MKEYIEKEKLFDCLDIKNALGGHYGISLTAINAIPAADAVAVGTYCPRCHFATNMKIFKTCPNCGAKMTEV